MEADRPPDPAAELAALQAAVNDVLGLTGEFPSGSQSAQLIGALKMAVAQRQDLIALEATINEAVSAAVGRNPDLHGGQLLRFLRAWAAEMRAQRGEPAPGPEPEGPAPTSFSTLPWPELAPLRAELEALDQALADPHLIRGPRRIHGGLARFSVTSGEDGAVLALVAQFLRLNRTPGLLAGLELELQTIEPEHECLLKWEAREAARRARGDGGGDGG